MKIRRMVICSLALLLSWTAKAQESVPSNAVFEFLTLPRTVSTTGMAGAGSTLSSASAAFSAFDNPTVLPFTTGRYVDAAVSYGRWAPASQNTLSNNFGGGVAYRVGRYFAISAGMVQQVRPSLDLGGSTFAPWERIIAAAAGVSFSEHISVGVSARFVTQALMADYKLSGTAFTAMLQYRTGGLAVAAGAANLGSGVKSESGNASPLPSSARLSASYELAAGPGALGVALDADYYFAGKFGLSVGASYGLWDILYLRAGYRYASTGAAFPSHLALGLGGSWKGFSLDTSFITANAQVGNSLGVSISYRY